MSLLAVLTIKVSAILLLALIGTLLLRRSSAAARHWVLAVGVVSAVAVPALHVLPTPPVARMAPVGPLLFDALQLAPYVQFTEPVDADVVGSVVALQPAGSRSGGSRAAAAAVASDDVVGRLAVTIWLVGAFAGLGVLLVGLARLRWFRASSSRVTDERWHRLCADLSRSCGLNRPVDLLLGPRPGLVATWGWRRPVVMLPASASEWSAERMRVVLLHELAHARRGDWILQMAAEALRCVWWFNPLAWMVRARLRRESEHAADDLVLAQGVPAATCATHLVELAREVRKHRRTWLPAPAMARPSNLEWRLSAMLNPRTNRRPLTRFARFGSLGVLVPVSIVVAGLQVGPVSASRSAESTGNAVEQEQPAEPASGQLVPVAAAPSALQERVQVGSVSVSRSAESIGSAVEQEQPAEPSSGRLVPVAAAPSALQERVQVGSVSASRSAESIGSAVEQEQPAEPSSEQIAELVAKATGLQEQRQTVLDEQQGDSDRPTGRPEPRTGVIEEATIGPTGEVDDIEVARSIPGLDEADEGRGAPGAHTSEADADDRSFKVLATRRASTLERELNAAAAVGYRLQTLTWRVGGSLWGVLPIPGDRREMVAIVARTAQPARFSYRVVAARDETESKLEARLNEAGEAGYRVREVGTSVILERDEAADPVATEFRVVTTTRIGTLEAEIAEAGRDGYRPVGLTPPSAIEGLVAILSRPTGMDPSAVVP